MTSIVQSDFSNSKKKKYLWGRYICNSDKDSKSRFFFFFLVGGGGGGGEGADM